MATVTVGQVYQDVRGLLNDTQITGGEIFNASYFTNNPNAFGEPYRSMYSRMMGGSKRVQRVVYLVLPPLTTVLIPATYGIVDFSEPEMVEERPAVGPGLAITSTDTSTPIIVTCPSHGLGSTGNIAPGQICNVLNTSAPWGNWFITIIDANTFSLNGSMSDGIAGAGGLFFSQSTQPWSTVFPVDLTVEGLDGQPNQCLTNYLWINEMFQFRGATTAVQLRITYFASGSSPTNPNYVINIDDCRDFLAVATASNAAQTKGWYSMADKLRAQAYLGDPQTNTPSLIDLFFNKQVMAAQRGPTRRQLPFRDKRYRFGTTIVG